MSRIYPVMQKMAQLLVGLKFKLAWQNSTKLHTLIFQYVPNHIDAMQMDHKCINDSCLKIVWPKIQYCGYPQY